MTLVQRIEGARASGDWAALAQQVPYVHFLGISFAVEHGRLLGQMRYAELLVGNSFLPALHGGGLGALLESAAHFELLYRVKAVVLPKTITLTVDYLRTGKPVDTFAASQIVRQGRRVATVQAAAWQEDEGKPIAIATLQLLIQES